MSDHNQTAHYQTALERLRGLIDEAASTSNRDPGSGALATATPDGRTSVRMIEILRVEPEGLIFFANINSGKAQQLIANPQASLCFFWPELREQVNIEGNAVMLDKADSNHYWNKRMRESQLMSWVSDQGNELEDGTSMKEKLKEARKQSSFDTVPRPATWVAFCLQPERIEFWPSGWERAHKRVRYVLDNDGDWRQQYISP